MTKIATDTYSFDKLRSGGYRYVDKTGEMLPLVDGSAGVAFDAEMRNLSDRRSEE